MSLPEFIGISAVYAISSWAVAIVLYAAIRSGRMASPPRSRPTDRAACSVSPLRASIDLRGERS